MSKRGQRRGKHGARVRRERASSGHAMSLDAAVEFTKDDPPRGRRRNTDPDFSLFHYTTAAGLLGIVQTGTLWATQANYLNDSAECRLLSRLLTPRIREAFTKLVPELIELKAFKPEIAERISAGALDTEAEKVTGAILRAIDRVSPIHITSFCRHRNGSPECEHGLLSQWRGYGKGGFAIQFDESQLDDLTDEESQKHSYQGLITRRVSYEDHEEAAQLERFDGIANASLKVAFEHAAPVLANQPEVRKVLGEKRLEDYIGAFTDAVAFLKSARFKEENEYRIVALPTRSKGLIREAVDERPWREKHFKEGAAGTLVPFIKLFEYTERPLPIKKIIVGPHQDQDNQVFAAMLLLEKHGIDVPVVSSSTTLRV
jgi:hypothetical protein